MNYVQSQSIRSNLIFGNILEEQDETSARTLQIVRQFIVSKLKVTKEERVHRIGQKQNHQQGGVPPGIETTSATAALCASFQQELERFTEVAAKRRRLLQRFKEEKQAGRRAWVSYDTLYIEGRPSKNVVVLTQRDSSTLNNVGHKIDRTTLLNVGRTTDRI
ncbi:hypothetical protein DPMN_031298 [Dreissena polymorpha]|uniref:Uncharacterized protein n=1 Tax=Dreissena polymorpha TaxID=45954 RepID=A0A9D4M2B1_DREPO|nr:hypothetical protein DPMN_031298 [Dreissena polymorpha]